MIQIDMDMPRNCACCPCGNAQDGYCYAKDECIEKLENGYPDTEKRPDWCPLKEVKHGKWTPDGEERVRCSECLKRYDWTSEAQYYDYCPKCGADMREEL